MGLLFSEFKSLDVSSLLLSLRFSFRLDELPLEVLDVLGGVCLDVVGFRVLLYALVYVLQFLVDDLLDFLGLLNFHYFCINLLLLLLFPLQEKSAVHFLVVGIHFEKSHNLALSD